MGRSSRANSSSSVTVLTASKPTVIAGSTSTISNDDTSMTVLDSSEQQQLIQTTDYEEDAFMFRGVGKRFRSHLKRVGEGIHFQKFFGGGVGQRATETRRLSDPETLAAGDFQDITKLIWSAFRVPFNALSESPDHHRAVPVILSLIKVSPVLCKYGAMLIGEFV